MEVGVVPQFEGVDFRSTMKFNVKIGGATD